MSRNLLFSTSTELIRLPAENVVFISAEGNYSSIKMVNGEEYVLTQQLGQMEKHISEMVEENDNRFIRIGKSLIVNHEFITFINPSRQKMILSDCKTFRHELSASKDALKALKDFIEKESKK
ncbi:MAG: LytTR family transcriptional regulator DNA-binding domain-containing protein [Muribaculaceae bacterium]|nr:LytTR family transcriptional regulator DNA-binding domain-containing protein [Muribaculaceae bacterium]